MMAGYYDLVLGLIPLSLAGLTALLLATGATLAVAIPAASVVTVGLIGHAMFVNAPVDDTTVQRRPTARSDSTPASGHSAD